MKVISKSYTKTLHYNRDTYKKLILELFVTTQISVIIVFSLDSIKFLHAFRLIDWIVFYAVSTIFQPYYGSMHLEVSTPINH